jgi:hypothetical protein
LLRTKLDLETVSTGTFQVHTIWITNGRGVHSPDEKELYLIITSCDQQVPGMDLSHNLLTGLHCTYVKIQLRPRKMLTLAIMNQMSLRIQPVDKRSNVTAKEVLLQAAAMMEQTPVMLATYR